MLKSMTGFGKAVCDTENRKITVEIKSLNSKQADVFIKLPVLYREKESEIRYLLQKELERGKIDLSVHTESKLAERPVTINKEVIKAYYNELKPINDELFKTNPDWLSVIMRLPETLTQQVNELDESEWKEFLNTIHLAIEQLIDFRKKEGLVLEKELLSRISNIEFLHAQVDLYESVRVANVKTRINQNLTELLGKEGFDKNRFEQELIYYLEKMDFTEEKIRLNNHCKYFRETCNEDNPGRKLGFITQEIGREINTLGSKANNSDIQKLVVQMKDELEKVKEQLLNIL
jgi:uncharacterized protein (TIGR00255 family)